MVAGPQSGAMTSSAVPTTLYQAPTSSASWRVRIALALKQIDYQSVWIDLGKRENLLASYGKVAFTQQVPCLVIDGRSLLQSVAIVEYLDETRPDPALLPREPAARAEVRSLVEIVNSVIQPMQNTPVRERLQTQFHAPDAAVVDWCRYWIELRFAALERALASTRGSYACADAVTMADVFLYPQAQSALRFGVDLARFPNIAQVVTNLASLDAFAQSHAPV
jgi:maleylacetoacetate isomerase